MDRLKRNPDVVWREEPAPEGLDPSDEGAGEIPRLTLVYLGTMYQLNLVGAEIWKLCDGSLGVEQIVAELGLRFDVDAGVLAGDVSSFVGEMLAKGWIQVV